MSKGRWLKPDQFDGILGPALGERFKDDPLVPLVLHALCHACADMKEGPDTITYCHEDFTGTCCVCGHRAEGWAIVDVPAGMPGSRSAGYNCTAQHDGFARGGVVPPELLPKIESPAPYVLPLERMSDAEFDGFLQGIREKVARTGWPISLNPDSMERLFPKVAAVMAEKASGKRTLAERTEVENWVNAIVGDAKPEALALLYQTLRRLGWSDSQAAASLDKVGWRL